MKYINKEKLEKIQLNKSNFYVAIDFDKTITSSKGDDSWAASGIKLGEDFNKELNKLYQVYGPIELDYRISFEEKNKAMIEWYYTCMELYYKYHLTQSGLKESIDSSNIVFRDGAKEFLCNMSKNNIPVIILSAGIGNVIEEFLRKNKCLFKNMYIISNFIPFDENGNAKEYSGELIHSLNKTMVGHLNSNITELIRNREYRLLFGDLIEDKNMVPKNEWDKTITVGFLDKNEDNNFEIYKQNFDIVLTDNDASFKIATQDILKGMNNV